MELRTELTTLDEKEISQRGEILEMRGHTVELRVPQRVSVGSPVKLELENMLSLGEVTRCRPEGDGYTVYIEMSEALRDLRGLSKLAKALLGD